MENQSEQLLITTVPAPFEGKDNLKVINDVYHLYFDTWYDKGKYMIGSYATFAQSSITRVVAFYGPRGGFKKLEITHVNGIVKISKRHKDLIAQLLNYMLVNNIEIEKQVIKDDPLPQRSDT